MWLKRSFRLPLPASPSSTNEVETVHPQVVDHVHIASDLQLSRKEAFPLFICVLSLQRFTRGKDSVLLAPLLCILAAPSHQEKIDKVRCALNFLRRDLSCEYFGGFAYSPRFFTERARAISRPASRSLSASRLSCAFFPRARASSTFTFPLLK